MKKVIIAILLVSLLSTAAALVSVYQLFRMHDVSVYTGSDMRYAGVYYPRDNNIQIHWLQCILYLNVVQTLVHEGTHQLTLGDFSCYMFAGNVADNEKIRDSFDSAWNYAWSNEKSSVRDYGKKNDREYIACSVEDGNDNAASRALYKLLPEIKTASLIGRISFWINAISWSLVVLLLLGSQPINDYLKKRAVLKNTKIIDNFLIYKGEIVAWKAEDSSMATLLTDVAFRVCYTVGFSSSGRIY